MFIGNIEVYGIIYKITNIINNKIYIGQTTIGFKARYDNTNWWEKTHNQHLKSSVKKYGIENFKVDEIIDIAFSKDELDLKEINYINYYNTLDRRFGYNNREGGSHGKHSKESREKMSKALKGHKPSQQQIEKMVKTRLERGSFAGEKNGMWGRKAFEHLTEDQYKELCKKRSENSTRGKHSQAVITEVYNSDNILLETFECKNDCIDWLLDKEVVKTKANGKRVISQHENKDKFYKGYKFKTYKKQKSLATTK